MSKPRNKEKASPTWLERLFIRKMIKVTIKKIENMKGSWKTSLFGWILVIGALVSGLHNLLDGDPSTTIDFAAIIDAFKNVGLAIPAGIGLIFSRDKDVSTEEQRAASKK